MENKSDVLLFNNLKAYYNSLCNTIFLDDILLVIKTMKFRKTLHCSDDITLRGV